MGRRKRVFSTTVRGGKFAELRVFSKLVELGYDLYVPVVDDLGVDAIVRVSAPLSYVEIQVKARTIDATTPSTQAHFVLDQDELDRSPPNRVAILFSQTLDTSWVLSYAELRLLVTHLRLKSTIGQPHFQCGIVRSGCCVHNPLFDHWRERYDKIIHVAASQRDIKAYARREVQMAGIKPPRLSAASAAGLRRP